MHRIRSKPWISALSLGLLTACASTAPSRTPPTSQTIRVQSPFLDRTLVRPPFYANITPNSPECETMRTTSADRVAGDTVGVHWASPVAVLLPPRPIPIELRGMQIVAAMRVDPLGLTIPGSLTLTGLAPSSYRARFETAMLSMRFWPAVKNGCTVNGHFTLTYTF